MYTKGFDFIGAEFDAFGLVSINGKPLTKPRYIIGIVFDEPELRKKINQWLKDTKIDETHMERINEYLKYKKYVCDESLEIAGQLMIDTDNKINIISPTEFEYTCIFHKEKKDNEYYEISLSNTKRPGHRFNKTFGLYISKEEKIKMEEE